jgi:ankyrin repeat protein
MTESGQGLDGSDEELLSLFAAIASGDDREAARQLDAAPRLATRPIRLGATRQDPERYFLRAIHHHLYAGDTALHVAAAAHTRPLAKSVVALGAEIRARNRRGAEPIHYAADGGPGAIDWKPDCQHEVITYLIEAGADQDAMDDSGVTPLHRAVRTRSSSAVRALLEAGADPQMMNKSGSTPLHLAVQNTGKSGSGSGAAKEEQRRIVALLLDHGARLTDVDANGKTVAAAASSDWIRQLLTSPDPKTPT